MRIRTSLRVIRYMILKELAQERLGKKVTELKRDLMIKGVVSSDGAFYSNLKDLLMEGKVKIEDIDGEKIVYITEEGLKEFKETDQFLKKIINE